MTIPSLTTTNKTFKTFFKRSSINVPYTTFNKTTFCTTTFQLNTTSEIIKNMVTGDILKMIPLNLLNKPT